MSEDKRQQQVFYWNTADNKEHTHKRVEWARDNGYLVCININIAETLFNKVNIGDIILAYEPKHHKISKFENGQDGFCMSCYTTQTQGLQSFTNAFIVTDKPAKITNLQDEANYNADIFQNWYDNEKHLVDRCTYNTYFTEYYAKNNVKYIFPVKFWKTLENPISTDKKTSAKNIPVYYGPVIKGFDKVNKSQIINNKNDELTG